MSLIKRNTLVKLTEQGDDNITTLNRMFTTAYNEGECKVNLYFDQWGYEWEDIQFIIDAGYTVQRNGACLWWEVSWE